MRHSDRLRLAGGNAVMHAGMDQRIVENEVVPQRQCGKKCDIGGKSATEIDRPLSAEKYRRLRFKRLMFGMVATKQPRTTCTHRHAPLDCVSDRRLQPGCIGKPEIVVGGEVDTLPGR
ncbi:hypothetical protein D3C87_1509540 [compost metagenome]